MNERIKELYQKAHREVVETNDYNGMPSVELQFDSEKFAELIVKECAAIDFYKLAGIGTEGDYNVTQVIKQHFGVE